MQKVKSKPEVTHSNTKIRMNILFAEISHLCNQTCKVFQVMSAVVEMTARRYCVGSFAAAQFERLEGFLVHFNHFMHHEVTVHGATPINFTLDAFGSSTIYL